MSSLQFNVREAVLEDLSILKKFEQSLIAFERPFAPNLREGAILYYDIGDLIVRKDALLLVAEINGEVVGSGYALLKKAAPYKKTEPQKRGKGIIGNIIDGLVKWSHEKNIYEIQLDVYAENESAIRAYKKLGFKSDLLKMRL
jgi:GNAT superfamily N-acetyltransferase